MHPHAEHHLIDRVSWLRAAVLGANDGLISTAAVMMGVAAAGADKPFIVLSGVAALSAGAMAMAAGEFVSVSSQADLEQADLEKEAAELRDHPEAELEELTQIYVSRGLERALAEKVAIALTQKDALGAHARDELGLSEDAAANPLLAAVASGFAFLIGAGFPLLIGILSPQASILTLVLCFTMVGLLVLGGVGAKIGGAPVLRGALRVFGWGVAALGVTSLIGWITGTGLMG